jgi:HSP20 family molecular chaperone IbpA
MEDAMFELMDERLAWMDPFRQSEGVVPAMNVWQDAKGIHVEAELPGVARESLEITVHDGVLTIRGEKKAPVAEKVAVHRRERAEGRFARALELPWEVDAAKVEATLKDGILHVVLPQSAESQPRRIEVR